jgi:hypothetical protein
MGKQKKNKEEELMNHWIQQGFKKKHKEELLTLHLIEWTNPKRDNHYFGKVLELLKDNKLKVINNGGCSAILISGNKKFEINRGWQEDIKDKSIFQLVYEGLGYLGYGMRNV